MMGSQNNDTTHMALKIGISDICSVQWDWKAQFLWTFPASIDGIFPDSEVMGFGDVRKLQQREMEKAVNGGIKTAEEFIGEEEVQ